MPLESTPPDMPAWNPTAPPEHLAAEPTRAWVLIRYVGQPLGQLVPVPAEGLKVGRAPENGLCLPDPEVSRHHAALHVAPDGGAMELRDLGSTNGVFVNGRQVKADEAPYRVLPEDVLRIGGHAFKVKHLDEFEQRFHQDMAARSSLDALTGVGNRATVLHLLETHVELARRHRRPLSLLLVDLDQFKRVNDSRGHAVGDHVLERVGRMLLGRLRASDPVGRLGGDEFLAVLPETPAELAMTAAEDLRRTLAEQQMDTGDGRLLRITCSLGVAELKAGDMDGGALLARADAALYLAKTGGRNRVVQAS
jgi:diguanylate cyclase (GGDEF)-like protein